MCSARARATRSRNAFSHGDGPRARPPRVRWVPELTSVPRAWMSFHAASNSDGATLGALHDVWTMDGLGRADPSRPAPADALFMKADMARFNEEVIPVNLFMFRKVMRGCLKRCGRTMDDMHLFVYPTFSTWDLETFRKGLSIAPERVYDAGLARHGHLQENDMVVNHQDAERDGRLSTGDLLMVTTYGAGFTWGAAVVRQ